MSFIELNIEFDLGNIKLDVIDDFDVVAIKYLIALAFGVAYKTLVVEHNGRVLENTANIAASGIKHGDTIVIFEE